MRGDIDELVAVVCIIPKQLLMIFQLFWIDVLRQFAFDINVESIVAGYQAIGHTVYVFVVDVTLRLDAK